VACPDCDLLNRVDDGARTNLLCRRCGAVLYRYRPNSIERSLALTIAALILFLLSSSFPFLSIQLRGFFQQTTLLTGIRELWGQGLHLLSLLVLLTCVVMPLLQMLGLLYILAPLHWYRRPAPYAVAVCRLVQATAPWCMMEVFMIGVLVALVKLGHMATIIPGISVVAFGVLIFVMATVTSSLELSHIWNQLDLRQ
jgi:paraquat-inducible protein A